MPLIEHMLTGYLDWVRAMPILSAMIQFAILGTFGEVISKWIVRKSFKFPFSFGITLWKMVVWAILAVGIKYAFKGYIGFVGHLEELGMLPPLSKLGKAFTISAMMNLQFGITLVLAHRVLDNIMEKQKNWAGLHKGIYSLIWFWIPAHTATFMLPDVYRIGLAALWSLVLGLLLGIFNRN
ncbi:MAG: hypothetical protein Q8M98_07145 [Candidatus Cloacimonadaceae bacterium]|nr:hypothetical protein [Candidatus Cloacimonadaceae bacterium]MDP3114537.1 hypothetical protein [Candidatus Cloacimonadaceae bacterium]